MNRLERLWRRTVTLVSSLIKTAGFISTVLTILTFLGLGSVAFGFYNNLLPLTIIGIAVFILAALIFIFLYTLLEEKTKAQQNATSTIIYSLSPQDEEKTKVQPIAADTIVYSPPLWEDEVEILLKEIVYEYSSDGQTMWQRKRLQIQVFRNGITHFTDRYRWTGSGKCFVKSITSGFNISNEHKEKDWDYFSINFPHPIQRGEVIDFTIEWELVDEEKIAVPYLSSTIDRETKHLLLQVILPRKLAPKHAYYHEFAKYIDDLPIATQEIYWSPATQSLSYNVSHPRKNHKYLIRWYND